MRRQISLACLLCAWLCANGAVWDVVQVVGWAKMFHNFSRVMPAASALAKTFDGSTPCNLCRISQTAQDTARQGLPGETNPGEGSEKILLACDTEASPHLASPAQAWPAPADQPGLTRSQPVPVRPPRV